MYTENKDQRDNGGLYLDIKSKGFSPLSLLMYFQYSYENIFKMIYLIT